MRGNHPKNALPLGHLLNDEYRVEAVLGVGGFAITYLATDGLGRQVAVKEYLPNDLAVRAGGDTMVGARASSDIDDFRWGLEKFEEEGYKLAAFDHPHVNRVLRLFKANGTAYLVLEYVHGRTLSEVLASAGGPLPADRLQRLLDELLQALEVVHGAGLVHCDIKPSNVMLREEDGSAVLLDFGASRQQVSQRTRSVMSAFTPPYAAIEQYETVSPDLGPWTDLYGLGVLAYRCIGGQDEEDIPDAPTRAKWRRPGQAQQDLEPAIQLGAGRYPRPLLKAVDWALALWERERPQSAHAMARAIDSGPPPPLPPPPPPPPPPPSTTTPTQSKAPSSRWKLGAALGAVVVALGAAAWFGLEAADSTHPVAINISPAQASVMISGTARGDVPWQPGLRLPAGEYTARATAPGFQPLALPFALPLKEPLALALDVTRYRLTVRTTPGNATVRVLGTSSPFASGQALPAGEHELEVSAPGHIAVQRRVVLQRDEVVNIALARQQFRLTVDTEPPGAAVRVEGATSFINGGTLPAGEHVVRVTAPGFRPVEQRVSLSGDQRIRLSLERQQYRLTVDASPADATVTLLEPPGGYRPGMSLPAGPVRLSVSAPRHQTAVRSFSLGEDTTLKIDLQSTCRTINVNERRCSMVPASRQVPQQVQDRQRISRSATWTGRHGEWANQVCARAELDAEDKLEDACDGQLVDVSTSCGSCQNLDAVPGPFGVALIRARCSARASGTCESTRTTMRTETVQEQRCVDVPVPRQVCD